MSCKDFSSWLFSPLEASHILIALQCEERLDESLFAWSTQIKDCNGSICAARYNIVILATDSQAFYFCTRLHLDRDNLLKGSRRCREDSQVAFSVTDCDIIAHVELK